MGRRDIQKPAEDESGMEKHPAFGMITVHRGQNSPGAVLFDSDLMHQHSITVSIGSARRQRDLNRDWIYGERDFVEVEMSEAQWAAFVSSVNSSGVPCTIRRREDDFFVPGLPYEPRLQQSMDEVGEAANKSLEQIREAFKAVEEKPNKGNIRKLGHVIQNAAPNMTFAAESLTEHAENVVQKAKSDIEAMVQLHAEKLGLDPGEFSAPELVEGKAVDDDGCPRCGEGTATAGWAGCTDPNCPIP